MKPGRKTGQHGKRREPLAVAVGPHPVQVAFAWYDRDSWEHLRSMAADPDALDESYDAWLISAESALRALASTGTSALKVPLDVVAAAAWAQEQGRPFDSAARATYVAVMAKDRSDR